MHLPNLAALSNSHTQYLFYFDKLFCSEVYSCISNPIKYFATSASLVMPKAYLAAPKALKSFEFNNSASSGSGCRLWSFLN